MKAPGDGLQGLEMLAKVEISAKFRQGCIANKILSRL